MICFDCKRQVWPWQRRGIDNQSHIECHRRRIEAVIVRHAIKGTAEMLSFAKREYELIERCYARR